MTKTPLPSAIYIDNDAEFLRLVNHLARQPLLAIDTESNSLHAYRERVCLIQVSTRTVDYIIDPLAIKDLAPFGALLADPGIEKVFHAAEYDLICLKRDYGFTLRNLFDTMDAARVCGYRSVGLGSLLEQHLNVRADKKHQRDDWARRPLPESSLRYAQMDTHYLPALRDILTEELTGIGRLAEAREVFEDVCDIPDVEPRVIDPDGFWKLGLPYGLSRQQMGILRELYLLRESIAEERDVPPFKVFSNRTLIALAEMAPVTTEVLQEIEGMSTAQIRRYGRRLLKAIKKGNGETLPRRPRRDPPDPVVAERYNLLHNWRKERAQQRGVDADVIISKQTLWTLARSVPTNLDDLDGVPGLGPWRLQTYGPDLLNVLTQYENGMK